MKTKGQPQNRCVPPPKRMIATELGISASVSSAKMPWLAVLCFCFQAFCFGIVLYLWRSQKNRTESYSISFTQLPLMLIFCLIRIHLSSLRDQHRCVNITKLWSLFGSPVFPGMSFFFSRILSRIRTKLCHYISLAFSGL